MLLLDFQRLLDVLNHLRLANRWLQEFIDVSPGMSFLCMVSYEILLSLSA